LVEGSRFLAAYQPAMALDHVESVKERMRYDLVAMKVAATAMTYILTENYTHTELFQQEIEALNAKHGETLETLDPAILWTLPAHQSLADTLEEKPQ
jgi:hypothetical protein